MFKNLDKVEGYIEYWLPLIKKCPEFQKIPDQNLEKFFENFKNLLKNLDVFGISVFEGNHNLRFSPCIRQDLIRKFEDFHKTTRTTRAYNRSLKNIEILDKMSSMERFLLPLRGKNTEHYMKLEEIIKYRTIPFLKNISLNENIALP